MGNSSGHIFISGIKHSGKTTFARLLAEERGWIFADADDLVLERIRPCSVREYYKNSGKAAFMEKEKDAVRDFIASGHGPFFLALGGGACDNDELMDLARKDGKIVYLAREEGQMLDVVMRHGCPAFLDPDDIQGSFHRLYVERDRKYRSYADLVVDLGPYADRMETLRMLSARLMEEGL